MIIDRDIEGFVKYCAEKFPVLTITGPRQSGKTTLAKKLFGQKGKYVTLEDPDTLDIARNDPRGLLNSVGEGSLILDEIQNCPILCSYIQDIVDTKRQNCQFVLTGSQNFLMLEKVSQSLAGRAAVINLLPFSLNEIWKCDAEIKDISELIWRGGYPAIYNQQITPTIWLNSYIATYLERDVRTILNITDLAKFHVLVRLCAGRIGQLVNFSSIATEVGISYHTIKSWISILEASYIIYLHKPYFKNFNKRLVKQPKLYFYDTALAVVLLGIKEASQIFEHYMKGALFENFVLMELLKGRFNQGTQNSLYFWRDSHGHEVDIVIDDAQLLPIEVKASQTFSSDMIKNLRYLSKLSSVNGGYLVYQGDKSFEFQGFQVVGWKDIRHISR